MKNIKQLLVIVFSLYVNITYAQQEIKYVKIETEQGSCIVKLYNETPVHRDNFIKLVKGGYLNRTTFNRILKGFVIQGGDPDSLYDRSKSLNPEQYWIKPEFNAELFHKRGAVAMGRDGNSAKESFTTQFYIVDGKKYTNDQLEALEKKYGTHIPEAQRKVYNNIGGTPGLDHDYTVFGEIIKGINLIDKITAQKVNKDGNPDKIVWMKLSVLKLQEVVKEMK